MFETLITENNSRQVSPSYALNTTFLTNYQQSIQILTTLHQHTPIIARNNLKINELQTAIHMG